MSDLYKGIISIPEILITDEIKEKMSTYYFDEFEYHDGILECIHYQARYGQFEELEEMLVKANIPFDRESDGGDLEEAELEKRYFRPDGIDITVILTAIGNEEYLPVHGLKTLLDQDKNKASDSLKGFIDKANPTMEPLEYFAWIKTIVYHFI